MTKKHILAIVGLCLLTWPLFAQDKEGKADPKPPASAKKDEAPKKVEVAPAKEPKAEPKAEPKKTEPGKVDPKTAEPKTDGAPKTEPALKPPILKPLRDPTAPGGLQGFRGNRTRRAQIRSTQLPEISLKGRVLLAGKEPAALIEIEKRVLVIRVGTELTLNTKSSVVPNTGTSTANGARTPARSQAFLTGLVLKVTKLTDADIEFEVLATKQTVIIR